MNRTFAAVFLAGLLASPAAAWGKGPTLQGATLAKSIAPDQGFIDDPFVFDGAGGRLAYVVADAAERCEIVVFDLAQKVPLKTVDISGFSRSPIAVDFALTGDHFFVVDRPKTDGPMTAALIGPTGKVVRRFGPADDIRRTVAEDRAAVVLYSVKSVRPPRAAKQVHHTVEVIALETGKRLGQKTTLVTDLNGHSAKLDFTLRTWANGYTHAVGIKGGTWDKREDQRSPDTEGWYHMPSRVFAHQKPIANVLQHTEAMQRMATHPNEDLYLEVAKDLTGLHLVKDGKGAELTLEIPFHRYDRNSLNYQPAPGGGFYFTLEIDPVNPDAVARKRADKVWLDLYQLDPGKKRAKRRARYLVKGKRKLSWRASPRFWAIVPRHIGFDRGGKKLMLIQTR